MTPGKSSRPRTPRKPDDLPDPASMGYEDAIAEWESIIDRIESGEVGLEESLQLYQRGIALQARCRAILDTVEQTFNELTPSKPRAAPADDQDDSDPSDTGDHDR